jgi:predicted transcriptional regulator
VARLNKAHRDVLSVLKTENRELSVNSIAQRTLMKEEKVRLTLEELAQLNYVEVHRLGRGKIGRAKLLPHGASAWGDAVNAVVRPDNVQADLAELKNAVEELQRAFEALESGESKIAMSPERIDAITNLFQKGLSVLPYLHQYIHF